MTRRYIRVGGRTARWSRGAVGGADDARRQAPGPRCAVPNRPFVRRLPRAAAARRCGAGADAGSPCAGCGQTPDVNTADASGRRGRLPQRPREMAHQVRSPSYVEAAVGLDDVGPGRLSHHRSAYRRESELGRGPSVAQARDEYPGSGLEPGHPRRRRPVDRFVRARAVAASTTCGSAPRAARTGRSSTQCGIAAGHAGDQAVLACQSNAVRAGAGGACHRRSRRRRADTARADASRRPGCRRCGPGPPTIDRSDVDRGRPARRACGGRRG